MAFNESFEAIMAKANEVAQAAAKKAKDMASIAKAKLAILTEEDKIKKAQTELGKLYYRDFVEGNSPDAAQYLPWCEKITVSKKTIEELKRTIEDLRRTAPDTDSDDVAEPESEELLFEVVDDKAPADEQDPPKQEDN